MCQLYVFLYEELHWLLLPDDVIFLLNCKKNQIVYFDLESIFDYWDPIVNCESLR